MNIDVFAERGRNKRKIPTGIILGSSGGSNPRPLLILAIHSYHETTWTPEGGVEDKPQKQHCLEATAKFLYSTPPQRSNWLSGRSV